MASPIRHRKLLPLRSPFGLSAIHAAPTCAMRTATVAYACNPSTLGSRGHLMSGVQDQPDQHGETPSLLKIQKVLAERSAVQSVTKGSMMLPENTQTVTAGLDFKEKSGEILPVSIKVGNKVSLPEYGGTKAVLNDGTISYLEMATYCDGSEVCALSRARWLKPVTPALWEAKAGGSRGQEIKTILANTEKSCLY
ncbi:10 kDa heat shock protein, mitochondrial [Plecturocebus cupreus]